MPRKKQFKLPQEETGRSVSSGLTRASSSRQAPDLLRQAKAETPNIHYYLGGAWKMHLPFAYDLMQALRPRVFVELGVHRGESYFAFCQSVDENRLPTRCYGIDTWRGDVHAGFYGPEIGDEVAVYNRRYAAFSHLLAMTFKQAAAEFDDNSIDLLHIDGGHRYEDVKKDFETWLPKLSDDAIVLLHDVEVLTGGFGVYRLWKEIVRPRRSFLFPFGYGLGVWKRTRVSNTTPDFVRRLLLADERAKELIIRRYADKAAKLQSMAERQVLASPRQTTAEASSPDGEEIVLAIYCPGSSGYSEGRVVKVPYHAERWSRLDVALHFGLGDAPLRLDPITTIGRVDIAAILLRSAVTEEVVWQANGTGGFQALQVAGSAVQLPHPTLLRVLSYGDDPQVYLRAVSTAKFDGPLRLELWLKADLGLASLARGISELSSINAASINQQSQAQQLLQEAAQDASVKEAEMESLKSAVTQLEADRAVQGETVTKLEVDRTNAQSEIEKLQHALADLENERDAQRQQTAELKTSETNARLEVQSLQRALAQLQVERDEQREVATKLETAAREAKQLGMQLEHVAREREALGRKTASLSQRLETSEREAEQHRTQLAHAARGRQALGQKIASLSQQLEELRLGLSRSNSNLAQKTRELERTRPELVLARNELDFAADEWEKAKAELRIQAAEEQRRLSEIETLRAELKTVNSQVADLGLENELLRDQLIVEEAAKLGLIQEFTSTAENLHSAKKDLATIRESEAEKPRSEIRRRLGFGNGLPQSTPREKQSPRPIPTEQCRFWLDSPTGPSVAGERVFYAGWVVPPPGEKVLAVQAIAAEKAFIGQYGFERADVAQALADRPGAGRSAFSIGVSLDVGNHEVHLQYLSAEGKWTTFYTRQHEVHPIPSRVDRELTTSIDEEKNAIAGWLENPRSEIIAESSLLYVSGWVYIKDANIVAIVASIDDMVTATMTHSLLRDDVAALLPQIPASRFSGFEGYLPLKSGFAGQLTLKVEAVLEDGTTAQCFQRAITVSLPEVSGSVARTPELSQEERYARWIETNKLTLYLLRKMARPGVELVHGWPMISIIVPTYNTPASYLKALIDSVTKQLYPRWQLCFADDASTEPHVRSILENAARDDSRIDVVFRETNGHIVEASNSALALAKGDYVGLLDHDDLLSTDALLHIAEAISADVSLDLVYTDEDKISPDGTRYDPIFKGAFSPEMALTHNYIQHFTVIRRSLVMEAGGFRPGFEGAQDLDLYLRVLEKATPERIKHIPFVCYHWRSHPQSTASRGTQKGYVFDSARKSIADALARRGLNQASPFLPEWAKQADCCLYQIKWSPELLKEHPVTIVIPTRDHAELLRNCVASLERTVDPDSVSLIIVDDYSEEQTTRTLLKHLASNARLPCKVIQPSVRSSGFNFSRLVNEGVAATTTPLVLLLNNDTEALAPGWLEEMVGWMTIDGVGAVGAKLLYPDNTIQHAGVVVGPDGGLANHIFHKFPANVIGFNFLTHACRNVSAVTAACVLTSRAAFEEVGGFDEDRFGMEFNDVDFCLRLHTVGRRVVFTPQSVLQHHSGQSRQNVAWRPAEHLNFLRRYPAIADPYYNENLDLNTTDGLINPRHFLHGSRVGALKVLMISHNLNLEGAPRVLFDQANYFKSRGYIVRIASRQDGPLRENIERAGMSVEIVEGVMPRAGEDAAAYSERLRTIGTGLNLESYDLIICNTLPSFWGVVLAKLFNLPVIWHVHESSTIEQFFQFDSGIYRLVADCFTWADRIVFESGATRRLLSRYETRDNFETIPGSIDVSASDRFRDEHSQRSMKEKHGLDPEKMVVSLIGTTCPRKGQHVFVEAIALLQEKYPDEIAKVSFVMLGARKSAYLAAYLDLLYSQLALIEGTDTRLIEECPEVFDFYRLTDIFVCASFQESFPRVLLEAMAFKLPIVSTDVFGIPEIILDKSEGLLGPAGDASFIAKGIERLLWDEVARSELGARAHAKVSRLFNSSSQLKRHLDLTKEVVARHV
jgi:GT2 family glycosyltransferase/glycosyltransferase involved in cell wall biosynthesis